MISFAPSISHDPATAVILAKMKKPGGRMSLTSDLFAKVRAKIQASTLPAATKNDLIARANAAAAAMKPYGGMFNPGFHITSDFLKKGAMVVGTAFAAGNALAASPLSVTSAAKTVATGKALTKELKSKFPVTTMPVYPSLGNTAVQSPVTAMETTAAAAVKPSFFSQKVGGSGFFFNLGQLLKSKFAFFKAA